MSLDTSTSPVMDSLQVVRNCTVQLRSECTSFRSFVVGMLDQLDMMRSRLAEREGWVNAQHESVAEQQSALQRMRQELQHDQGENSELQSQLIDLHTELEEKNAALEGQRQRIEQTQRENSEFRELLERLEHDLQTREQESQRLQSERDAAVQQLQDTCAASAQLESQLQQTREKLEQAQGELESTRRQLSQWHDQPDHGGSTAAGAESQRVAELEDERAALELELEQTRHRAAELANSIAEQRKQLADERNGWSDELRQLRSLVKSRKPAAVPQPALAGATAAHSTASGNPDPVVGSVLAQFAQLQKDAASRVPSKDD